jgi:hypothetical protein
MKPLISLTATILFIILTAGCLDESGGVSDKVRLIDLSAQPTLQVNWPEMNLPLPPSNIASVGSVAPKIEVVGDELLIEGRYVFSDKSPVTKCNLQRLRISREKLKNLKAFWKDPDGTRQPLEVIVK